MRITLRHNVTGRVLWEDEVECPADVSEAVKRGLAVAAARNAGADLHGANLSWADLRGADLHGAYLSGADLHGARLGGANLRGAYLHGANLGGDHLRGADLRGANLGGANLCGANLGGANLSGAYLGGADLGGANLSGANLRGAVWGDGAKWAEGVFVTRDPVFVATDVYDVWLLDTHAQIGCPGTRGFLHGIDAWAGFGDAEIGAMDGARALAFWRAWRGPLLAIARASGRPA